MITCSVFKNTGKKVNGVDILESVTKGGCTGTGRQYEFADIGGTPAYIGPHGHNVPITDEVRD